MITKTKCVNSAFSWEESPTFPVDWKRVHLCWNHVHVSNILFDDVSQICVMGKNCRLRLQIYRSKLKKIKLRQLPSIKILHKYRWRCLCHGVMFFVIGSESFIVFCLLAYMCLHRHIRYIHSRKRMFLIKKYVRKKNYEEKQVQIAMQKEMKFKNLKVFKFDIKVVSIYFLIAS